jgi:hypothetical protein
MMATMLDGESYLGRVLVRPVSPAGDVTLYCWPLRCLKGKFGGPTFGLDIKTEGRREEILRFDPHGNRGHWHKNGYDKLGARGSHQDFPEGLAESGAQVDWSLEQLRTHARELLVEAGHPDAAAALDPALLAAAVDAVRAHVEQEGDLRTGAIAQGLLTA